MKVGFVVTAHHSRLRPNGVDLINNYIRSLKDNINYEYLIVVVDNGSDDKITLYDYDNVEQIYINDQSKLGITGAWNIGILEAIKTCDIIFNTNDDLTFNDTINDFINFITHHEFNNVGIYGPVCNPEGVSTPHQRRKSKGDRIIETTNDYALNGFFLGFTKEMFNNFQKEGAIFSKEDKWKISAQENEIQERLWKEGCRSFIVERCYINHIKIRGWQKLK